MTGILNLLLGAGGVIKDTYFNLVSLLLPGNGTNGAQNNTFLDSSTNNFTITRNGNTTQGTFSPFSQTGWSAYFDGSNDNVSFASGSQVIPATGDFTIEAWIYPTSVAAGVYNVIYAQTNGVASAGRTSFQTDGSNIAFQCAGTYLTSSSGTLTANRWNYVAATRTGSSVSLYVNGSATTGLTASGSIDSGTSLTAIGANWSPQYMAGYISNFRVSTTIRSNLTTVPTSPFTNDANTRVLTLQNNRFIDNSSSPFTLTPNNGVAVQAFSPFAPTAAYTTAAVGGSGYFDGNGDELNVGSNAAFGFGTSAYTVELWVYLTAAVSATHAPCFVFNDATGGFGFYNENGGNQLQIATRAGSVVLASTTTLTANTWNHIVAVRSGTGTNQTAIFVNGNRVANGTDATNYTVTGPLKIGGLSLSNFYVNGYLSNVRIVKGSAVYDPTQSTITVPTAPLTAITNTSLLLNYTNAGITDATAKNDLETVGNAQVSTTINNPFGGTSGSMYFDGAGSPADRLTGPNTQNTAFGTGNFAIEFFIYPTSSSATFRCLFDSRSGAVNTGISIWQNGTSIEIYGSAQQFVAASVFTINSWQHVAVSRSSNTVRVYVGGTQRGSNYTNSNDMTDTRLVIGNDNGLAYPFVGYMSNFRITKGNDRNYTGATITVPSAPFPVQ